MIFFCLQKNGIIEKSLLSLQKNNLGLNKFMPRDNKYKLRLLFYPFRHSLYLMQSMT